MLEYPESHAIARQMRESLVGKTVAGGEYINPNANIFNPEGAPARYHQAIGGTVLDAVYHAPEIYIMLSNGYGIQLRQGGGKIRYNEALQDEPKKCNFRFPFTDGSSLTYSVLLWSYGVDVISHEAWAARVREMDQARFQPHSGMLDAYLAFVHSHVDDPKQAIKVYLAKNMAGIMSTFAGEILLYAKVHPAIQIGRIDDQTHERIYTSMRDVLTRACEAGGRTSEVDLYGNPGGYLAMSERKHIGEPCPLCGNPLEKASAGGIIAYCKLCQAKA